MDDEEDILQFTQKILERAGYSVKIAGNGEQALKIVKGDSVIDLIILDIQMPKMNGYTFISQLRKMEYHKLTPVLVVTAYPETEPIFRRKGVKDYLIKPVKLQDLLDKVKAILGD